MEVAIVIGALTVVLTAFGSILYRATIGDRQNRRLEKLKEHAGRFIKNRIIVVFVNNRDGFSKRSPGNLVILHGLRFFAALDVFL